MYNLSGCYQSLGVKASLALWEHLKPLQMRTTEEIKQRIEQLEFEKAELLDCIVDSTKPSQALILNERTIEKALLIKQLLWVLNE